MLVFLSVIILIRFVNIMALGERGMVGTKISDFRLFVDVINECALVLTLNNILTIMEKYGYLFSYSHIM